LASTLDFKFSQTFDGTLWNMLQVPASNLLVLEVRNEQRREARFSALDIIANEFVWKEILFDESWWIGLTAATKEVLLLHVYRNTENPDAKDLLAWDIHRQQKRWQLRNFLVGFLSGNSLYGRFADENAGEVIIDVRTGDVVENKVTETTAEENIRILKPFQYVEGTPYFDTVKAFLNQMFNIMPAAGVEYLEEQSFIFISYHAMQDSLVNYLIVLTADGSVLLHEKLGERLKGLGFETFFILSGCLFFVRNKCELVSYRIV